MEYSFEAVFSCSDNPDAPQLRISGDLTEWTCDNYWDDVADFVACLVQDGEETLGKLFPKGHSYSLSEIKCKLKGEN